MIWKMCSRGDGSVEFSGCYVYWLNGTLLVVSPVHVRQTLWNQPFRQGETYALSTAMHPIREIQGRNIAPSGCLLREPGGTPVIRGELRKGEETKKGDITMGNRFLFEGNYIGKAIFGVPALGYSVAAVQSDGEDIRAPQGMSADLRCVSAGNEGKEN